jgi:hypothetical protein
VLRGTSTVLRGERGSNASDLPDVRQEVAVWLVILPNKSGIVSGLVVETIPVRRCGCSNIAVRCKRKSLIEPERKGNMGKGKGEKV